MGHIKLEDPFQDLEQYIKEHWTGESKSELRESACPDSLAVSSSDVDALAFEDWDDLETSQKGVVFSESSISSKSLEDLISEVGKTFHDDLFERIALSGMTDVEVYRRANMDRKLFSKIRSNPAYHPRKSTVLALAIALRLDIHETEDFLSRAEYALSPGSKSDVIIRYFIERNVFDIFTINIALHDHGLPVLE